MTTQQAGDRGTVSAFGGIYAGKLDVAHVATAAATPEAAAPAAAEPAAVEATEAPAEAAANSAPVETAEPDTETEEATEAEATPAAETPAEPAKADDFESKLAELAKPEKHKELGALLQKHGLDLDRFGRVQWVERKKFREEKAAHQQELQRQVQQLEANFDKRHTEISAREERVNAFEKAVESGDFDGMAKAIKRADWNAAQKEAVERLSDPTYQRMVALERDKEEREKREKETEAQTRARHAQEQQAATIRTYRDTELLPAMKSSRDRLVSSMADDPLFVETVLSRQVAALKSGQEPPTAEQVAKDPAVRGHLQKLYSQLKAAFEPEAPKPAAEAAKPAPAAAPAPAAKKEEPEPAKPKKPIPKQVPAKAAMGSNGKARDIDPTSDEWFKRTYAKIHGT